MVACLPVTAFLWGFTVDDAFIPARVAGHLMVGEGPRFNALGPVTDAVTPLGWAQVIAAAGTALRAPPEPRALLGVARGIGLAAWLAAAGALGRELASLPRPVQRLTGFVALAVCVPLGAWAGAGMETALVAAWATWAALGGQGADFAGGAAAAWRPELLPWALVLSTVRARGADRRKMAVAAAGVLLPVFLVAVLRLSWFGELVPLSAIAKVPHLPSGLRYALGGLLLSGPYWLLSSRGMARLLRGTLETWAGGGVDLRAIALASCVHPIALVLAGGDWMSFFRLYLPVLPGVILLGASLAQRRIASGVRLGLVVAVSSLLLLGRGADARSVLCRVDAMIEEVRPLLAGRSAVASVDVGWIGAATDATLIDLAGVTDPRVAALPGGHTTKRVSPGLLSAWDVDTLVFRALRGTAEEDAWDRALFFHGVEGGLARGARDMGFHVVGRVPHPGTEWEYLVLYAEAKRSN